MYVFYNHQSLNPCFKAIVDWLTEFLLMSLCNVTSLRQMLKPQGQLFPLPYLSPDLLQDRAVSISSQPVHLHLITSRENQLLLLIRNEHWLKSCEHICADADVYIYAGFCDLLPWQMCLLLCFCNLHPRASRQFASTLYTLGQWQCSTWRGHKSHMMVRKWTVQCSNMLKNRSISCMFPLRTQSTTPYKCLYMEYYIFTVFKWSLETHIKMKTDCNVHQFVH